MMACSPAVVSIAFWTFASAGRDGYSSSGDAAASLARFHFLDGSIKVCLQLADVPVKVAPNAGRRDLVPVRCSLRRFPRRTMITGAASPRVTAPAASPGARRTGTINKVTTHAARDEYPASTTVPRQHQGVSGPGDGAREDHLMRRPITRALLAAAVAGATITTLGVISTGTAGASTGTTAITSVVTQNQAGYFTGSGTRRFRFIATGVTVTSCQPSSVIATQADNPDAEIWLLSSGSAFAFISVTCNGGLGSVAFGDDFHAVGVLGLSPGVGDVLRISIFRNRLLSRDEFTATNTRTGRKEHVTVSTPAGIRYIHAQADSFAPDNSAITLQTSQIPLWSFASTDVTTNSGVHGGLTGPWSTSELIDTIDGTSTGHVVMFPSSLTNNGHDFSTLLNTAS